MLRVVIVEDSEDIQRRLVRLLQPSAQVQVLGCAGDVASAIALIDRQRPDLVVLDLGLRGGDRGATVLQHVVRHWPRTRVVVLSNQSWPLLREGFIAAGARAFFDKSFEFREVRDWIFALAALQAAGAALGGGHTTNDGDDGEGEDEDEDEDDEDDGD